MNHLQRWCLFIGVCVFVSAKSMAADSIQVCTQAKAAADTARKNGRMGFFKASKLKPNEIYRYDIDSKCYKKTLLSDSSIHTAYRSCFNESMQTSLDSVFKLDFFGKADSILKSYDKSGRGYKNADFPEGAGALQKFVDKKVDLPRDVQLSDSGKVVRVFYSFIIDETGKLSDFKLLKSNCKACEAPVLEALQKLPAFMPATEAGQPKKVKYIFPYIKPL